jgi:hypothetical protein
MKYFTLIILVTLFQAAFSQMKPLEELTSQEESSWRLVEEWIGKAKNDVEILERDSIKADTALYRLQMNTSSLMAAVVYESGGILVDNGWIRILGSGSDKLKRSLPEWNKGKSFDEYGEGMAFVLIADDVVGGFYALNGGQFGDEGIGQVFYFAPDNIKWEPLGIEYSDFIYWAFTGDIGQFYEGLRWKNWEEEVLAMGADKAMSFSPYLWTKYVDLEKLSRKAVSMKEMWEIQMVVKMQLMNK